MCCRVKIGGWAGQCGRAKILSVGVGEELLFEQTAGRDRGEIFI